MSSSPPENGSAPADGPDPATTARKAKARRKLRRRASGAVMLLSALTVAGGLATAFSPTPQVATADATDSALITEGKKLYETSCITCHGTNLQGSPGRGPSLVGVGDAAVYFQVESGRMPAVRNEAQAQRKPPKFTPSQIDQLMAYVQSVGGGPTVLWEMNADGSIKRDEHGQRVLQQEQLRGKDLGRGSELFRLNCASCHNFTGRGGALSGGKFAPPLDAPSEQEIYAAMLTGPQNMPKFSNRQLSEDEKKDIIGYIKYASETNNPGGYGLGGFGPVSEGMVMWFVGIVVIVGATMWIGSRS